MAYRVELTARAISNIRAIYKHIDAETSKPAAEWYRGLRETIFSLEQEPQRGITTPENSALQHLLYGNKPHIYRIIYSVDRRQRIVRVLHIRHGARTSFTKETLL